MLPCFNGFLRGWEARSRQHFHFRISFRRHQIIKYFILQPKNLRYWVSKKAAPVHRSPKNLYTVSPIRYKLNYRGRIFIRSNKQHFLYIVQIQYETGPPWTFRIKKLEQSGYVNRKQKSNFVAPIFRSKHRAASCKQPSYLGLG